MEVLVSSGSTKKLRKYQLLGVPEVWFWQDGIISVYIFQNGEYIPTDCSNILPSLDLTLLCRCLLMDSSLEALREFRKNITQ
ncbi:MAG: hypothetical protein WCO45_15585 [Pseudanabaena sp. ELA607]